MARSAYSAAAIPTRTGRGTEYEIFARVTRRLRQVQSGEGGFAALVRALHDNRSLWTTLAADVAVETNELSKPLRAQIFYLAQFTTEHSRRVIAGDATVDALIDINTAVMRGLRGEGEGA